MLLPLNKHYSSLSVYAHSSAHITQLFQKDMHIFSDTHIEISHSNHNQLNLENSTEYNIFKNL